MFVQLAKEPLPRFGNDWLYGDLHYHSQGTDNEGESAYNYRGVVRAMGAMGLDFLFATEHASNSPQIQDSDLHFDLPDITDAEGLSLGNYIECALEYLGIGIGGCEFKWNLDPECYTLFEDNSILRDMSPERYAFCHDLIYEADGANQEAAFVAREHRLPQGYLSHGVMPQLFLGGEVDVIPEVGLVDACSDEIGLCRGVDGRECATDEDCVDTVDGFKYDRGPCQVAVCKHSPETRCIADEDCKNRGADGRDAGPCIKRGDCCKQGCGDFFYAEGTSSTRIADLCNGYVNVRCSDIELSYNGDLRFSGGVDLVGACTCEQLLEKVDDGCLVKDVQGTRSIMYGREHILYLPAASQFVGTPGQRICRKLTETHEQCPYDSHKLCWLRSGLELVPCDTCEKEADQSTNEVRVKCTYDHDDSVTAFVSSSTTHYGGASRRLKDVLAEVESPIPSETEFPFPRPQPKKGYMFIAHPANNGGGPGPDGIPWSSHMFRQAFRSPIVLGIEFWNQDIHLEVEIDQASMDPGFYRDSSTLSGTDAFAADLGGGLLGDPVPYAMPSNIMRAGFRTKRSNREASRFDYDPFPGQHERKPQRWTTNTSPNACRSLSVGRSMWDMMLRWGLEKEETMGLTWLNGEPRRVFMAGGSDAHGDLNYYRGGYFVHSTHVNDSAIGKPRNLLNVGPPGSEGNGGSNPVVRFALLPKMRPLERGDDVGDPTGACCVNGNTCQLDVTQAHCTSQSGTWFGDGSTSCGLFNCFQLPGGPIGACCVNGSTCNAGSTEAACTTQRGIWYGAGSTTCSNCPQIVLPTGACCVGGDVCQTSTAQAACMDIGGVWQGIGSTTCANCPASPPGERIGACCIDGDNCQTGVSQASCAAQMGAWQGIGTTNCISCPRNTAPRGACCLGLVTCETNLTQEECLNQSGIWKGDGSTSCSNCPPVIPTGACCIDGWSCKTALPQSTCTSQRGIWHAGATACANCPPAAHSQEQVVEALRSGQFCVTDGPILRIAIDNVEVAEHRGVIDDGDAPMGSILHVDRMVPGSESEDLEITLLIEYRSTEEFGPVDEIKLVGAGSYNGGPARTYILTPPGAQIRLANPPLETESDPSSGLYSVRLDQDYWIRTSDSSAINLDSDENRPCEEKDEWRCAFLDNNKSPYIFNNDFANIAQEKDDHGNQKWGGVKPWVVKLVGDAADVKCDYSSFSCDRFYLRAELTTQPKAFAQCAGFAVASTEYKDCIDIANCECSPTSSDSTLRGDCVVRRAFSNPIWVVVDHPIPPEVPDRGPTLCGVIGFVPMLGMLMGLGLTRHQARRRR